MYVLPHRQDRARLSRPPAVIAFSPAHRGGAASHPSGQLEEHAVDGRFFTPGTISVLPVWGEPDTAPPVARDPRRPAHDPPLCPRDEAVFLLTAAAEIEHALMVQYLFAAYSVRVVDGDPDHDSLLALRELLLQVA